MKYVHCLVAMAAISSLGLIACSQSPENDVPGSRSLTTKTDRFATTSEPSDDGNIHTTVRDANGAPIADVNWTDGHAYYEPASGGKIELSLDAPSNTSLESYNVIAAGLSGEAHVKGTKEPIATPAAARTCKVYPVATPNGPGQCCAYCWDCTGSPTMCIAFGDCE